MSDIPKGWIRHEIGEIASVIGGGTPSREILKYWNGNIPWVTPTEVTKLRNKYISSSREYITEAGLRESSSKLLDPNTVLMTSRASIGFCAINKVPVCTNQGFQSLKPNTSKVDVEFLYYLISTKRSELEQLSSGSTFLELSPTNFRKFKIVLPAIGEQKKIAEILSSADKVIELTEIEIEKLQNLKKGMMQDLLTKGIGHAKFKESSIGKIPERWKLSNLGELYSFKNGVNAEKESYGKGTKFINISEILAKSYMYYSDIPGMVEVSESDIRANLVIKGDILFNRTSETQEELGMTSVYLSDDPVVFGGFVIRGRPLNDSFEIDYTRYCFHAFSIRNQIINFGQGAVRANIGQESLSKVVISIPPKDEQVKISNALMAIDRKLELSKTKLNKLINTKRGLMQDLLTGKVRVKV